MLVDDNSDDNFFHERVINKSNAAEFVVTMQSSMEAIEYLKSKNDVDHHRKFVEIYLKS